MLKYLLACAIVFLVTFLFYELYISAFSMIESDSYYLKFVGVIALLLEISAALFGLTALGGFIKEVFRKKEEKEEDDENDF